MVIAVSYDNGQIGEHFGHAECFALYNYKGASVEDCEKKLLDSSALHGHQQMADLMKENDVDAVICGGMGDEAAKLLLSYGIIPVIGYKGEADIAADLLITGQLPIVSDSNCSGGCGGCGGGCHHDDEGNCGCGCSGCH